MKTVTFDETKWVLVPAEATQKMAHAFGDVGSRRFHARYRTALAAAPSPEQEK